MSDSLKSQLVFLPGFMGQANDFSEVIQHLAPHAECHVLELPQAVNTPQVFEEIVTTWFKTIRHTLPARFYLYGYSLGGRLAMAIAEYLRLEEPKALQGLFLESAHPGLQNASESFRRLQWDSAWAKAFGYEPLPVVLSRWYQQSVFHGLPAEDIHRLIAQRKKLNGKALATQIIQFSLGWQPDYRAVLADETLPVTYFSGERDQKFTTLGQQLQGVRHCVAEGLSHNIHFQSPAWIAEQIIHRLKES